MKLTIAQKFDKHLNKMYPNQEIPASELLKQSDPVAYKEELENWITLCYYDCE